MPRPTEPALSTAHARAFRKQFRKWCLFFGATNDDVGAALDKYLVLGTSDGGGSKAVANAMMSSRKMTHKTARRLSAALLLTDAVRTSARKGISSAESFQRLEYEKACLGDWLALLDKYGALPGRRATIAAFIPPSSIEAFADALAREVVRIPGIPKGVVATVRSAVKRYLRAFAPEMASAWRDAALEPSFMRRAAVDRVMVANLVHAVFGDDYVYQIPVEYGHEFSILRSERPELFEDLAISAV